MGLDPGLDHMLAKECIDKAKEVGATVRLTGSAEFCWDFISKVVPSTPASFGACNWCVTDSGHLTFSHTWNLVPTNATCKIINLRQLCPSVCFGFLSFVGSACSVTAWHCCSVKFFWLPLSTVGLIWPIWEVTSTEGLGTNGDPAWHLCSVCILMCLLFIVSVLWINVTDRILYFFLRWPTSTRALWQSSEIQVQLEPPRSVAEYGSVCYVFKKWRGEVLLTFQLKAR